MLRSLSVAVWSLIDQLPLVLKGL